MESFREEFFRALDPVVAGILGKALDGREVTPAEALELFKTHNLEFQALVLVADWIRHRRVGDTVTYVHNRNVNFTNVCYTGCRFCAFSRRLDDPDAYLMTPEEVALKTGEAWRTRATEVCIQGGLHPKVDVHYYEEILRNVRRVAPEIHIHAFSPMEVFYSGSKTGFTSEEALRMLKEAGLNSMPGTAAEILDDDVRSQICPRKMSTHEWVDVVKTAHRLGIPTTATIMYGHVETYEHLVKHFTVIKELQKETKGFTEFIPLSFVHWKTPGYLGGETRAGASGVEDIKMHAVSRIMMDRVVNNIQVSWVKLGPKLAQLALNAGANDFGGTLMEENISRTAGGSSGQGLSVAQIRELITNMGRIPVQRTTTYEILGQPCKVEKPFLPFIYKK